MIISGFADEIHKDLSEQIIGLKKLNIDFIELRGVDGKSLVELTYPEMLAVKKALERADIGVSALGSSIGKISLTEDFDSHFQLFKKVVEFAKLLECPRIRIFSFYRNQLSQEVAKPLVYQRMSKMVDYAKEEEVLLLHENEKGIYGEGPVACQELFDAFGGDHFGLVLDPANFVQCGYRPYPEAFSIIEKGIKHVHIKDALMATGQVVPPGRGDGEVEALLRRLKQQNYQGFLTLEPHLVHFDGLNELEQNSGMEPLEGASKGYQNFGLAKTALDELLRRIEI